MYYYHLEQFGGQFVANFGQIKLYVVVVYMVAIKLHKICIFLNCVFYMANVLLTEVVYNS